MSEDWRGLKQENISYNPSRGGISTPRTSPTWGCEGRQDKELEEKRKDHMGGRYGGRKFPGTTYFPPSHWMPCNNLISCIMRKWHMNSNFIASNPFYHLQQNFDGTSVLRKVLRHTNGGLGCKVEGYIREGNLPVKGMNIFL